MVNKAILYPLLFLGAAGAGAGQAEACSLQITNTPDPIVLSFEPFAGIPVTGQTSLVLRSVDADRTVDFRLRPLNGPPAEEFVLEVEPNTGGQPIRKLDRERFRVDLASGEDVPIELTIRASHEEVPSPGQTNLTYAIDAVEAATGMVCLQEATLPIRIWTPPRAQINLAGASGGFEGSSAYSIDFGTLEANMRRSLALQFRSNSDATILIDSENDGELVHERFPQYTIPYTLQIAGQSSSLAGQASFLVPPASSFAGTSLPMVFTIGNFDAVPFGSFSDLLTITVNAM